ncbi:hypothetical protein [Methylorubrum thiocyanatum]|uniref:hypothetical protein n=1 Tax=Methylorubrum thiocyanatum TaxID=47958 RepID=UPI00398C59FF
MRFLMPAHPCEFEIPDEWLAGLPIDRQPALGAAYRPTKPALFVPLAAIQPPRRNLATPKDWHGFDRIRFRRVLKRMAFGHDLDPVPLREVPPMEWCNQLYPYVVANGYHRFFASIVAGFDHLPGEILGSR